MASCFDFNALYALFRLIGMREKTLSYRIGVDREIPPSGFTKSGKTLGKPRVLPDLVTPRVGFPYPHLYGMKESYSLIK